MTITPPTRAELQERIPVRTRAGLRRARVEMARRLAAAHGVARTGARIPRDALMLYNEHGTPISATEYEQADWIDARNATTGTRAPYQLGIHRPYLLAALERTAPDEAEADEPSGPTGYDTTRELIDDLGLFEPSPND